MTGTLALETQEMPAYQLVRRQRIIDAAKDLLRANDYESIQIRDVASEANVALGTLYRYFSSKEHLYANVVYEWALPFSQARKPIDESLLTTARLGLRLRGALAAFEKHPYFYMAILQLRTSRDPEVTQVMRKLDATLEEPMRAEMHTLNDEEAADITVMIWALLLDVSARVIIEDMSMPVAYRVVDRFIDLIAHRVDATGS